jgi:FkbM family methyltransferase
MISISRSVKAMAALGRFVLQHPGNRGRPVRSVGRVLAWQLTKRLPFEPKTIDFVEGTKLLGQKGASMTNTVAYCGLPDFAEMAFLLHYLRPGDLFLDIGANAGVYSMLAAGLGARVVAFEPDPDNRELLERHVTLNKFDRVVQVRPEAVSSGCGLINFTAGLGAESKISRNGVTGEGLSVPTVSLDSLKLGTVAAMKIDVEGFEGDVFSGAQTTLEDTNVLIVEFNESQLKANGSSVDALDLVLRKSGFRPSAYDWNLKQLRSTNGPDLRNNNTLYVRHSEFTEDRVRSATRRFVPRVGNV